MFSAFLPLYDICILYYNFRNKELTLFEIWRFLGRKWHYQQRSCHIGVNFSAGDQHVFWTRPSWSLREAPAEIWNSLQDRQLKLVLPYTFQKTSVKG